MVQAVLEARPDLGRIDGSGLLMAKGRVIEKYPPVEVTATDGCSLRGAALIEDEQGRIWGLPYVTWT